MKTICCFSLVVSLLIHWACAAEPAPLPQDWDYGPAMRKVAERFKGRPGVVLHVGDSITHANPYGQWARFGKGQSDEDQAIDENLAVSGYLLRGWLSVKKIGEVKKTVLVEK